MTQGVFRDGHPRVTVKLFGTGRFLEVECILDTGFEGYLSISGHVARQLGGYADGFTDRMLADGTIYKCPYFFVEVELDERIQSVEALVLGGNCLLGTALFHDCVLHIEIVDDGSVFAEPI